MDTIWAPRVLLPALILAAFATSAEAMPAGPAPDSVFAGRTISDAGVTIGRKKALPKKKRIHRERQM